MLKKQNISFLLLAIAGILGFAYQQHGRAIEADRAHCLASHPDREDAAQACDCFADTLDRETSFAYSILLIGPLLTPQEVKSGALVNESLAACGL